MPLPNWRKASDYHFPLDFPDRRWAWEFLRRNPEYQKDFASALSRFLSKTDEFGGSAADIPELLRRGGTLAMTGAGWNSDPMDPGFYLPVDEKDRWGLHFGLLNPATDAPSHLTFNSGVGRVRFLAKGELLEGEGLDYPWVKFDLHLPLKPQFDAAAGFIERIRDHLKIKPRRAKHHRKLWSHYLRLLDADLDERTPKQIADALDRQSTSSGLDERKVWNQLRAARAMTQPKGYLSIFLSPEPRQKIRPSK